MDGANGRR